MHTRTTCWNPKKKAAGSAERVIGTAADLLEKKVYEEIEADVDAQVEPLPENPSTQAVTEHVKKLAAAVKEKIKDKVIAPAADQYGLKNTAQSTLEKQFEREYDSAMDKAKGDYEQKVRVAQALLEADIPMIGFRISGTKVAAPHNS